MKKPFIFLLLLSSLTFSQGLFDSALDESSGSSGGLTYELNGFTRGVAYIGKIPGEAVGETKSAYGETALNIRARKGTYGDAYADIRFRKGNEFGSTVNEFNIREAYVNTYIGNLDIRVGQQIVVWGRADGLNPTDNITPKNLLTRSPNEDDKRLSNFLVRSFYNFNPFRLEFIWVPIYQSSVIPTHLIPLPEGVSVNALESPSAITDNGSIAAKINLEMASFDGSLSYFRGYNLFPGILPPSGFNISLAAYKLDVFGADFSTTVGSFGLRGEFAYRKPVLDYESYSQVCNPDFQYILGTDKTWGDFSLIAQYVGRYVTDFEELAAPKNDFDKVIHMVEEKNRMIASQLYEISHSATVRPALNMFHETLTLEMLAMINFTTQEMLYMPKATYKITDDLTFAVGIEIYDGPSETLFGTIKETLSSGFIEFKASF